MGRPTAASPTTVALTDDQASDPLVSGRKAATLACLLQSGFPCADGMVIPARIHELFEAQKRNGAGTGDIPAYLTDALAEIIGVHHSDRLAVRSSGVVEDTTTATYAGLYTSVLDVSGIGQLRAAVLKCWESTANVAFYRGDTGADVPAMAVLVQRLLEPDAAGAAFAADPMSGAAGVVSISAVRGRADKLMQGETGADEWTVTSSAATCVRNAYDAITTATALAIADLARRVSAHLSYPAEIEWALVDGGITLLQARPMTGLTDRVVTWPVPSRGEWRRDIRLGEWLPEPVTPLFTTWFLPTIDRRFRHAQWRRSGVLVAKPSYRVINGWYYHSPLGGRRSSVFLRGLLTHPGFACAMLAGRRWPSIANRVVVEKEVAALNSHWPRRYDALLATVEAGFDTMHEREVFDFIDRMIDLVSDFIWPMMVVGGAAWRSEYALARYYRKNILPDLNMPYHGLLADAQQTDDFVPHAVSTLDWSRPTLGELVDGAQPQRRPQSRIAAPGEFEQLCFSVLSRRKLDSARFRRLLTLTRASSRRRGVYTANLTRPWPILRQALRRLGTVLETRRVIEHSEHVYFLTRDELREALSEDTPSRRQSLIAKRTHEWKHQCALRPPLALGTAACLLPLLLTRPAVQPDVLSSDGVLHGIGVSPGRVTGQARLVDHLTRKETTVGDVLIVRSFVPALAPLIRNAGAVAADQGSVAAHMSVIAREYGVPAVVGLQSVTETVREGDLVTVDGTTGCVYTRVATL